jgi:acetyl esterase/lipase
MNRSISRRVTHALGSLVLVVGLSAIAHAAATSADANQNIDALAEKAADRFARAMDRADVSAGTVECSLPWMNAFAETASDAASLKRSLELYCEFPRRHPEAGLYYRGIRATLPFEQYRQRLEAAAKEPRTHIGPLTNLDDLKLAASDRVVLVNWMTAYAILVRVRDGRATVAGLGPLPSGDAVWTKMMADHRPYRQVRDVVYGRCYGTALTLDVLTPARGANGAAIVYLLSGDFVSQPMPETDNWVLQPLLSRGYTVFTVVHGGIPKYTIPEMVREVCRAVRFTRFHSHDYGIDPGRIGVMGSSSGGYLSLMLATTHPNEPPLADGTDPIGAPDEIDAVSCRVQAAACFFPPTDWLDYGEKNKCILDVNWGGPQLRAVFELREFDTARFTFAPITDRARIEKLLSELSPARRVTHDAAPTLILHGEKDPSVPLQQSQLMIERLKAAGVPASLVVKPGAGHGWPDQTRDTDAIADWFDRYMPRH